MNIFGGKSTKSQNMFSNPFAVNNLPVNSYAGNSLSVNPFSFKP